jgi:hypothetical protein
VYKLGSSFMNLPAICAGGEQSRAHCAKLYQHVWVIVNFEWPQKHVIGFSVYYSNVMYHWDKSPSVAPCVIQVWWFWNNWLDNGCCICYIPSILEQFTSRSTEAAYFAWNMYLEFEVFKALKGGAAPGVIFTFWGPNLDTSCSTGAAD